MLPAMLDGGEEVMGEGRPEAAELNPQNFRAA